MLFPIRQVQTHFGLIRYREAGEGPPLVLLHSNGHSSRQFEPLMERLAGHFTCIAWDQPGHGDSDPLTAFASVTEFTERLIAFIDALGLGRTSVLGNSIGGAIVADLGARHHDRIDALFVCECPLRNEDDWAVGWDQIERNHAIVMQPSDAIKQRVPLADAGRLDWWNIDRSKAGSWAMMATMWALRQHDMAATLSAIPIPAVLIYGTASQLAPRAEAAATLVPTATLEWVKDAGHLPMLDDPDMMARIVLRHASSNPIHAEESEL